MLNKAVSASTQWQIPETNIPDPNLFYTFQTWGLNTSFQLFHLNTRKCCSSLTCYLSAPKASERQFYLGYDVWYFLFFSKTWISLGWLPGSLCSGEGEDLEETNFHLISLLETHQKPALLFSLYTHCLICYLAHRHCLQLRLELWAVLRLLCSKALFFHSILILRS